MKLAAPESDAGQRESREATSADFFHISIRVFRKLVITAPRL